MLPGVLAAAVPVAIHLLAKHRAREVAFPSLRFLKKTVQRTASRRRLEEILLLVLRALALGLVALALARPRLSGGGKVFGLSGVACIVILDNSLSMSQDAYGVSAFDRAQAAAREVFSSLPPGSRWAIWYPCNQAEDDPLRILQARPSTDIQKGLIQAEATSGAGHLSDLIRDAVALLREEKSSASELFILTDGQLREWEPLAAQVREIASDRSLQSFIYTAEAGTGSNIGIEALTISVRAPLPGEEARVEVKLKASGEREARTTASLYLGGALAAQKRVTLPRNGTLSLPFAVPLMTSGWVTGLVQIDRDTCNRDNRAVFSLQVREHIRILLVEGNPSVLPRERASFYMASALAPLGTGPVKPRRVLPGELIHQDLSEVEMVCLIEVPDLPDLAIARLKTFVRGGGTLALIPGQEVKPDTWNQRLGARSDAAGGLLPAPLGPLHPYHQPGGRAPKRSLAPAELGHPLIAAFASIAREALRRTRVDQAFFIQVDGDSPARVAISLDRGEPFLVSKTYGSGHTILWAAPPRPGWTSLQARPVFVPLMHTHAYLGQSVNRQSVLQAGARLVLAGPERPGRAVATITPPAGEVATVRRPRSSQENPLTFSDTWQHGLYTVEITEPEKEKRIFAVNPAAEEVDLTRASRQRMVDPLKRFGAVTHTESTEELAEAISAARDDIDLMDPLLMVVLVVLLAEAVYGAGRTRHAQT